MLTVTVRARCLPTEDRERVSRAITQLFPDAIITGDDPMMGTSSSVEAFAEQLRRQRIRGVARAILRRGVRGDSSSFRLNKQVAAIGKVSFSEEEHPLGDLEVTVRSDRIECLIDDIAPNLRKGARG